MEKLYEKSETGCCTRFNPTPWEEKEITWDGKLFLKDRVTSLFHIPLNFGEVIVRNMEKINRVDALTSELLMLSDENSLWGSDLYIAVTKEIPDSNTVRISGTFLTKVFEGPYKDAGKWAKDMKKHVESSGKIMKNMYFFYTTCPKCAKAYGKNYTVLLARI